MAKKKTKATPLEKTIKKKKKTGWVPEDLLSTGSSILNLACSGNVDGGLLPSRYYLFVGDSSSGKTFLCLTCFAEAVKSPKFKDHRLIYDGGEDGALMDWGRFFGKKVEAKVELKASERIEDFYDLTDDLLDDGRPFIMVLDSMDALSSIAEHKTDKKQKDARKANKDAKGSYGDGKAKYNSAHLRRIVGRLAKSDSILIIISQSRDNPAAGLFESSKTRSGGRSMKFYAALEMWTSRCETLTRTIRKKKRQVGIRSRMAIKKNRLNGTERTVEIPIYHSFGIDDIGSSVDWLISEGVFPKTDTKVTPTGLFDDAMSREAIIKRIGDDEREKDLAKILQEAWDDLEAACVVQRKKRYE